MGIRSSFTRRRISLRRERRDENAGLVQIRDDFKTFASARIWLKPKKQKPIPGFANFLTIMLGSFLSLYLSSVAFPEDESFLVGGTFAVIVAYFIRPHPPVRFWRWTLEWLILIADGYLFVLKIPLLLKHLLMTPFAYGIPIAIYLISFIVWTKYKARNKASDWRYKRRSWAQPRGTG